VRLCVCLYVSGTEACPTGRSTLVILRCHLTDATESTTTTTTTTTTGPEAGSSDAAGSNSGAGVKVSLSSRCATGTCDGCNFVLMMRSSAQDVTSVPSETFTPTRHFVLTDIDKSSPI